MLIGPVIEMKKIPFLDMLSYLEVELLLGVVRNRHVLPYPQWKHNMWLDLQQFRKLSG